MKIIEAGAEYLDPTSEHPYVFIEKVGRLCYKSEDQITESSAVDFVKMLAEKKHTAMLEHAHIYMKIDHKTLSAITEALNEQAENISADKVPLRNYLNITEAPSYGYLSGSLRAFAQTFDSPDMLTQECIVAIQNILAKKYPEIYQPNSNRCSIIPSVNIFQRLDFINDVKRNYTKEGADNILRKHLVHTVKFICDRGVTHELVRHRPVSFAQESTRYCNYAKGKFDNQITVIKPCFWAEDSKDYADWKESCEIAEKRYMTLIENGATAQQARSVLPHSVKADIIVTATENEWQHILNLRYTGTTGAPHPQMKEIITLIYPALTAYAENRIG